jgi:uncharacterized protein YidB (DUF937 family)
LEPIFEEPAPVAPEPRPVAGHASVGRRGAVIGGIVGAVVLVGAIAASSFGGQDTVLAASTASPSPAASTAPDGTNPADCGPGGALGPNHEAVSDTSVAAQAIGISEADLQTALSNGQTMAQVAQAHGVDVQKVIDALVADANDEIATALKNGTITQAQADAEKARVTQRVTAQVDGTFNRGRGDHGAGRPNDNDADGGGSSGSSPTATPSA